MTGIKNNPAWKRLGKLGVGINLIWGFAQGTLPPRTEPAARQQQLHSHWANHEKHNKLPQWRRRANELGYQLREPSTSEHSTAKRPIDATQGRSEPMRFHRPEPEQSLGVTAIPIADRDRGQDTGPSSRGRGR